MGPGFGGKNHRIKSAGHDPLRAIEALRQIKQASSAASPGSTAIRYPPRSATASALWTLGPRRSSDLVKHLGADVVTEMSLPIGMSYIANASETLREFARHAYQGLPAGHGMNLRGNLVPACRTRVPHRDHHPHDHGEALHTTGSFRLDEPTHRRRNELLLAAPPSSPPYQSPEPAHPAPQ